MWKRILFVLGFLVLLPFISVFMVSAVFVIAFWWLKTGEGPEPTLPYFEWGLKPLDWLGDKCGVMTRDE